MKSTTQMGWWFSLCFVLLLVGPMFISAQTLASRLDDEVAATEQLFGTSIARWTVRTGDRLFDSLRSLTDGSVIAQGVHTDEDMRTAKKLSFLVHGFAIHASGYLLGVITNIYCAFVRLIIVGIWCVLLMPWLIASAVDGLTRRDIVLASFGIPNPTAATIGINGAVAMLALPMVYIVAPVSLPITSMLVWAIAVALPLRFAASHASPILAR